MRAPFVRTQWGDNHGFGIATIGDVVEAPNGYELDGRIEDLAFLEFGVNAAINEQDEAMLVSYIETIKATTGFKKPDGSDLDASLQLNDEVMP
jgi:hypothetical protein